MITESILFLFLDIGLPREITVFIISIIPIASIRQCVSLSTMIGLGFFRTLFICSIGNIIPAPAMIVFFSLPIRKFIRKQGFTQHLKKLNQLLARQSKQSQQRVATILFLFVAIPLPATGVWVASFISIILGIHPVKALLSITAGTFANITFMLVLAIIFPGLFGIY